MAKGLLPDRSAAVGNPVSGLTGPLYGVGVGEGDGEGVGDGVGEGDGLTVMVGEAVAGGAACVRLSLQAVKNKRSMSKIGINFFMNHPLPPLRRSFLWIFSGITITLMRLFYDVTNSLSIHPDNCIIR